MKTIYKVLDINDNRQPIEVVKPYHLYSAVIDSIIYYPSINDPEDPNDEDELVITFKVQSNG